MKMQHLTAYVSVCTACACVLHSILFEQLL